MLPAGFLFLLQSQLRTQLLEQLRKLAGPDAVRAAGTGPACSDQSRSMWHAALNCMLAEYLQASNCQFTLSVFNSETDTVPGQPAFSTAELCQLLRLDKQPQLLQRVQELLPSQGTLLQLLLVFLVIDATVNSCWGRLIFVYSSWESARHTAADGLRRLHSPNGLSINQAAADVHIQAAMHTRTVNDVLPVLLSSPGRC
jgi:hypothetical protein